MRSARTARFTLRHTRHWLRVLLLSTLFAALQGTLGGWVVPAVAGAPAVLICTAQGPVWVALGADPADRAYGAGQDADQARGMPCAWASAHLALAPATAMPGPQRNLFRNLVVPAPWTTPPPTDHARRVLLMSAMRAPPARG